MTTVGIAGAGLSGRLVALELARAGCRVTLFDRDNRDGRRGCSWVGAGMLAPFAELEKAEPIIARLGVYGLQRWPEILADLPRPVFFRRNGSLVVAHRQDLMDLEAFKNQVLSRLEQPEVMRSLDAAGVEEVEPELAGRFGRGLYFPDEGQIDAHDLLPALEAALVDLDVTWRTSEEVTDIGPYRMQGESFDLVIDTRGLGARPQVSGLRGVRGELIRVSAPEVSLNRPVRLMHPRYPLYIVPRAEDTYLIGATSIESEDMRPLTVKSALELLSAAYSLHPGFAEAHLIETAVHCRPAFPDNLPKIQKQPGLIIANGLYRHGYLVGPAVADTLVDAALDRTPRHAGLIEDKDVSLTR
ncbi:MAG: glycine oxidase ThiO [Acidobacteriota bacterium]|nr:glycine oxidase ThiO [Acidobacteriota bacterium]